MRKKSTIHHGMNYEQKGYKQLTEYLKARGVLTQRECQSGPSLCSSEVKIELIFSLIIRGFSPA